MDSRIRHDDVLHADFVTMKSLVPAARIGQSNHCFLSSIYLRVKLRGFASHMCRSQ
jgi:hypothetical protein